MGHKATEDANHEQDKIGEEGLSKKKPKEAEDALEKVTNSPFSQIDGTSVALSLKLKPMHHVHMKTF